MDFSTQLGDTNISLGAMNTCKVNACLDIGHLKEINIVQNFTVSKSVNGFLADKTRFGEIVRPTEVVRIR